MLHVLVVILKLIGIAILAILLILLFLLSLVLFVPVRYQAYAERKTDMYAKVNVSWMFHLLHFGFYKDDKSAMKMDMKIAGTSLESWKHFIEKAKRLVKFKKTNTGRKVSRTHKINKTQDKNKNQKQSKKQKVANDSIRKESSIENNKNQEDNILKENRNEEVNKEVNISKEVNIINENISKEDITNKKVNQENTKTNDFIQVDKIEDNVFSSKFNKVKQKLKKLFAKIIDRMKRIFHKFKNIYQGIKNVISKVILTFKNAKDKLEEIKLFLQDEGNKMAFGLCKEQLVKLIKHIRPQKYKIYVRFGTGDPALTGQILGVFGMLMPVFKNNATIVPDFENIVVEGDIFIKGRITIARLLLIGWKLYRDKNVTRCYHMIMD